MNEPAKLTGPFVKVTFEIISPSVNNSVVSGAVILNSLSTKSVLNPIEEIAVEENTFTC